MFISTTQINVKAVTPDCDCNAVSVQGNQEPTAANDFTAVLKAVLSDLNKTGLLTNQNGQPVDINQLADGLLSEKDVNAGQDQSLTDMLQQIMAQLQMTGQMPGQMLGMVQPVIVNITQNSQPLSSMIGNSDVSQVNVANADNAPVQMANSGNAGSRSFQLNGRDPGNPVPEIKPEEKVEAGVRNDVNPLLQSKAEQNNSVLQTDGFKGIVDPLLQSKDVQSNNGIQVSGLKNTGDTLLQSKNMQKTGSQNTSSLTNNIPVANADIEKPDNGASGLAKDLAPQIKSIAANNEHKAVNVLKDTGAETDADNKELNNPVLATAHSNHSEYGKNATAATKETVHVNRLSELSEPIAKSLGSGNNNMTIKLNPPELGNVQIRLRMENGVLKVDFKVDSNAVKDAFTNAIPNIKASLEDSGIKSGDFFVNLKNSSHSDGREQKNNSSNYDDRQQQNNKQKKSESTFFELFA